MFGFKKDYQINYYLCPDEGARKAQTLTAEVAPTLLRFYFEPDFSVVKDFLVS